MSPIKRALSADTKWIFLVLSGLSNPALCDDNTMKKVVKFSKRKIGIHHLKKGLTSLKPSLSTSISIRDVTLSPTTFQNNSFPWWSRAMMEPCPPTIAKGCGILPNFPIIILLTPFGVSLKNISEFCWTSYAEKYYKLFILVVSDIKMN